MRKVVLSMRDERKYEVIKSLVDKGTKGNKKRAAVKLGLSIRSINRLIKLYKDEGKQGFIHKNTGKSPSVKYDDNLKEKIINLYIDKYSDANITHFAEIVLEDENVNVSSETIRLWLLKKLQISPKAHKNTKKKIKKLLKEKSKKTISKKESNAIKEKIEYIETKMAHPRRPRCKYMGEMIQMDASEKEWIIGNTWTLHLAIDDASGTVTGAYFDKEETLNGYYHVLEQILVNYGVPAMFYTDKRTVFEYKRKKKAFDNEDTFTQFSYACHKLGIEIKTTSVPEAKGRIERLNESFQSRLPIELRRANVKTIEEANEFLKSYLKKYNHQFALQLNNTLSVFEPEPNLYDINNTLAILSVRTIDHGHTIKFKNNIYLPANNNGNVLYLQEGMKVIMVETFDGRLVINAFDNLYIAKKLTKHELVSKNFDKDAIENPIENSYILPRKSPWRYDDFLGFLAKQKHRPEYNPNLC